MYPTVGAASRFDELERARVASGSISLGLDSYSLSFTCGVHILVCRLSRGDTPGPHWSLSRRLVCLVYGRFSNTQGVN